MAPKYATSQLNHASHPRIRRRCAWGPASSRWFGCFAIDGLPKRCDQYP